MSTNVGWKQLNLFDKSENLSLNASAPPSIADRPGISTSGEDLDHLLKAFLSTTSSIRCSTLSFVGSVEGFITNYKTGASVRAYENGRCLFLHYDKKFRILFSIGEELVSANTSFIPTLKVWKSDLTLVRSTKISNGSKIFPVSCFACLGITQVAVGLENGLVILLKGDFTRDRTIGARVVHESKETLTGLGFRDDGTESLLYIATSSRILTCSTSSKDSSKPVDFANSDTGHVRVSPQDLNQEMAIADNHAVTFYGPEGRGPCFIIEGEKTSIHWFKGYLVVVSREYTVVSHDPIQQSATRPLMHDRGAGSLLTIYDLKGKYIAFQDDFGKRQFNAQYAKAIGEPIHHVIADSSELIIVTASRSVYKLREIDLSRKLDLLYSKHLYTLALSIILQPASLVYNVSKSKTVEELVEAALENQDNVAQSTVKDTCKRYADYLYSKTEYDGAVKQYIRTIGHLQPSYVIRKFLDAQRIHNLTSYLQALHSSGLANTNHTTLLLNCYTKLNDLDSLNDFIDTSDAFDVDNAIIVCRNSGFYQQALGIASKFEQHDWYIKIQIDDLELYDEAISYTSDLPTDTFVKILEKYGMVLVSKRPQKMTKLLLELVALETSGINVEDLIAFYINRPEWSVLFLEGCLSCKYGINLYTTAPQGTATAKVAPENPGLLLLICDSLLDIQLALRQGQLSLPNQAEVDWDTRILTLLTSDQVKYDLENALFLAQQYHFKEGLLVLYEKLDLFKEYLEKAHDFRSVLSTCRKYGDKHPDLWIKGFEFCAKQSKSTENDPQLIEMLQEISNRTIYSDVEIIQLLSKCEVSLGSVRSYLLERMQKSIDALSKSERAVESYHQESLQLEKDIKELQERPLTFQNTKCELCKQALELPVFHFLCKHSFHAKCLGDMTHECPRCAPERHLLEDLIKTHIYNSSKHELFEEKISKNNSDSFSAIIDCFGKGMMNGR